MCPLPRYVKTDHSQFTAVLATIMAPARAVLLLRWLYVEPLSTKSLSPSDLELSSFVAYRYLDAETTCKLHFSDSLDYGYPLAF